MEVDEEYTNDSQNSIISGQIDSSCSSTEPKKKGELIQTLKSESEYWEFLEVRMPASASRSSNSRTYCKHDKINRHKTRIETRYCKGHMSNSDSNTPLDYKNVDCEVSFQCYRCNICQIYEIFQYESHVNGCDNYKSEV